MILSLRQNWLVCEYVMHMPCQGELRSHRNIKLGNKLTQWITVP
jgi:hypothetical protein